MSFSEVGLFYSKFADQGHVNSMINLVSSLPRTRPGLFKIDPDHPENFPQAEAVILLNPFPNGARVDESCAYDPLFIKSRGVIIFHVGHDNQDHQATAAGVNGYWKRAWEFLGRSNPVYSVLPTHVICVTKGQLTLTEGQTKAIQAILNAPPVVLPPPTSTRKYKILAAFAILATLACCMSYFVYKRLNA